MRRLAALAVAIALCVGLLELGCRIYARLVVYPLLDAMRVHWRNYYRPSDDPRLAYELRPQTELVIDGRRLRINRFGVRDDRDDLARDRRRVAILGDSVVFGVAHSQERSLSALMQRDLDPSGRRVRVLNFGMGGLGVAELAEYLRVKDAIYHVDDVLYVLNLNDFTRRESRYEGGDAGLYRIYRRPRWVSLWMVRKGIYRFHRGPGWYAWLFEGNEGHAQREIERMQAYAGAHGIRFAVVVLPVGTAYSGDGYGLRWIHERIQAFLGARGVPSFDLLASLGPEAPLYFDRTDHLVDEGNARVAQLLAGFLRDLDPALAAGAGASGDRRAAR